MSNLFYRNPRLLTLTIVLIIVSGLSSYHVLPRLEDPILVSRVATITTRLPGARAERIEALITDKLEAEVREVEEVHRIDTSSRAGLSHMVIELDEQVIDVEEIWSRVRNKIDDAQPALPAEALEPEFETLDVKAYALLVALVWQRDSEPDYAVLRRNAELLEETLLSLPGTEKTEVFGDPDEEIVVQVLADELASLGLTVSDVARQIRASDAKVTAGQMRGRTENLLIEVESELDSVARIASMPIHCLSDERVVLLGDIAQIQQGITEPASDMAIVSGRPAIVVGVMVQSDQRVDRWTGQALGAVNQFSDQLSRGLTARPIFVQNRYVQSRLAELLGNLIFGALAVMVVMLVLMGWRSALIVGAALPLTCLLVLLGLRVLNIPIQQMSVTGLVIALGLLIDNAIVMVDEVRERTASGASPAEAVNLSVRHLGVPLFGSTLTTALAFMPLALLPGGAGEFVSAIAVSVILAIFGSLALSLTVVPALAVRLTRWQGLRSHRPWWDEGVRSQRVTAFYRRSLAVVFADPRRGILLGLALPLVGYIAFGSLTEQFFPPSDRDQCRIDLQLASHVSLAETLERVQQVRTTLLDDPNVVEVDWFLGRSAPAFYYNMLNTWEHASHFAEGMVTMASSGQATETIRRLQQQLDTQFPGMMTVVKQLEQGPPFEAPVEVRLYGSDLNLLREKGEQLRGILAELPDVIHTSAGLTEAVPKLALDVDEEQARLSGLDHLQIAQQLNSTLEGAVGGSVLEGTEELPVRVRVGADERGDLARIASLNIQPPRQASRSQSQYVPLETLGSFTLTPELATIPRRDGQRVNVVRAYITAGVLPAAVLSEFQQRLAESSFTLPSGYRFEFGGESAERDDAVQNLLANVGPLLVVMIAALVLTFGSFRLAGVICAVGALSVGLGLTVLWLFGHPFGFMAIIGTMGLVGVAINDSIVVLAALREDSAASRGDVAAMQNVVVRSTRHVIATSLTTMAGFMPLVLSGGGLWPPLAVTIAGGVLGATLLALYFTPSAYLLVMCPRRVEVPNEAFSKRVSSVLPDTPSPTHETTPAAPVWSSS